MVRGSVIAAGLIGLSATAAAAGPAAGQSAPCFFINQWQGWKAPSPDVLYLKVNMNEVYRVELSAGSPELQWPDAHLISVSRGSDSVCSPLDLDLAVADLGGIREHLIARSLTKLTPEEVAAIPPKYRP
ncbi:MAG TPA: hypothetical protein VFC47_13450 [Caulobacteraceae bacterium]|nr:hypothetical protein [Caulobacteraceae bacterium]